MKPGGGLILIQSLVRLPEQVTMMQISESDITFLAVNSILKNKFKLRSVITSKSLCAKHIYHTLMYIFCNVQINFCIAYLL